MMSGGIERWVLVAAALFVAAAATGWTDSVRQQAARGNRFYFRGKYDEAVKAYGEGIIDHPDSDVLHFNLAAAQYRQGKYAEAIKSLDKIGIKEGDPLAAKVAYNRGNAQFQLGRKSEEKDPEAALVLYAQALASFRRAMSLDPEDTDAKFNHELVEKRIAELKKRIEEEKKKQAEEQGEQQEQPQPSGQQEQENAGQGEREEDKSGGQEEQREQQAAKQEEGAPGSTSESERAAGGRSGEMSADEARALLGAAKREEVDPSEIAGRIAVPAELGEPLNDW